MDMMISRSLMYMCLVMTATIITASAGERDISDLREAGIRRHLNRLNKPALKSIKSPDGDIIDCVRITDQPAFDHPLLKNHTIQMRPSIHAEGVFITGVDKLSSNSTEEQPKAFTQLWQTKGKCPENTIPIRRTRKKDLLRAKSVENYGKKNPRTTPNPTNTISSINDESKVTKRPNHQYAVMYLESSDGKYYYGSKATINVWKPEVRIPNEFSAAQMWIMAGDLNSDLNTIEAGWQVYKDLYGDDNPRFSIYWTRDAYQNTGCYNLMCSGFVQTNNAITLGGTISPVSTFQGPQYDITIQISRDPPTGNWWLKFNEQYVLGYWPASLFTKLQDGATTLQWGGEIVDLSATKEHTTTDMGSGFRAEQGFGQSCFVRNILIVDSTNAERDSEGLQVSVDQPNCYNLLTETSNKDWGTYFYFGGPGRSRNCP